MAKLYVVKSKLENDYKKARRISRLAIVMLVLSILFVIPTYGLSWLLGMASIPMWGIYANKARILKSGYDGEINALKLFKRLPEEYRVFSDVNITFDGKSSQLDNVVVGPNGIFVIETKNLNGEIYGNEEDQNFSQHKTGRKGGEYSKSFYSPIKQVNTHVFRLSSYLKANNLENWIQSVVFFSNPHAEVFVNSEKTPVFASSDDGEESLFNYIFHYENRKSLSDVEINQIVKLLV